jgi:glycosyltransferase involved in cell wall biosynthesis
VNIIYLLNVPSFFLSHRLAIARAALQCGYRVSVLSGCDVKPEQHTQSLAALKNAGIEWRRAWFTPSGINPLFELMGLCSVIWQVYKGNPDVLHTVTPKGNLYGGLAARLCRVPTLVAAVSGQGFLFTGQHRGIKKYLAALYLALIRWVYAHPNCKIIVQNRDDYASLLSQQLAQAEQLVLIPGSGVALSDFESALTQEPEPLVILPARLLTDKGVLEFVQAARQLKPQFGDWRFALLGAADGPNPAAISSEQVRAWVAEGHVEWWGQHNTMPSAFARAAIVCLPSYREGMPKALLEAAAAGRPVVTTDAIGCREAIIPGETGLLVPVADAEALAAALQCLICDAALRARFGLAGRRLAEQRYRIESVVDTTLSLYRT